MHSISLFLKLVAPVFFVIAAMHLVFGLGADAILGAQVSAQTTADPSLNSQNRFYGVAFALYGIILYISALDIPRYKPILKASLYVFFAAGLSRIVSWAIDGQPAPRIVLLSGIELIAPPLLMVWLNRATRDVS